MILAFPIQLSFDYALVWQRVREACGLKHETVAAQMELTPTQLSQAIKGNGHVSHQRFQLLYLDADTKRFAVALIEELNRLNAVENADELAQVTRFLVERVGAMRMAKARIDRFIKERTAC